MVFLDLGLAIVIGEKKPVQGLSAHDHSGKPFDNRGFEAAREEVRVVIGPSQSQFWQQFRGGGGREVATPATTAALAGVAGDGVRKCIWTRRYLRQQVLRSVQFFRLERAV